MSDNALIILWVIGMLLVSAFVPIITDDYLRRDITDTKVWKWISKSWKTFWK